MITAHLLAALALQTAPIPYESNPNEDDWPSAWAASFYPGGGSWLLPHTWGTIVEFDMTSMSAVKSDVFDDYVFSSVISPDGTKAVIERDFGRVTIHALPGFANIAETGGNSGLVSRLIVNQASTRCLTVTLTGSVKVSDLTTGAQLSLFSTPGSGWPHAIQSGLAADDQTYVTIGPLRIRAFDSLTGQETSRFTLGAGRESRQMMLNPQGTRAYVLVVDQTSGTDRVAIDTFDLPTLNRISTTTTTITGTAFAGGARLTINDAGTRAVVSDHEGAFAVDVASGNAFQLSDELVTASSLTSDGEMAGILVDNDLVLFDAGTGQPMGTRLMQQPFSGYRNLTRHPTRPLFIVSNGVDRLEIVERTAGGGLIVQDVNSGFGDQEDGAAALTELRDGRRIALLHSGSDDVSFIDVESETVLGQVDVEREPVGAAELSNGQLAIIHGRGASLTVLEPDALAAVGRVDLLGRATAIENVPGTTRVWVQVIEPGLRALQLIDAGSQALLATVPLPAPSRSVAIQPDVVFDFESDQAFVVDAAAGQIWAVDLAQLAIVGAGTFRGGQAAQAFPSPGGQRVTVTSSAAQVTSWIVSPAGLTMDWEYTCVNPGTLGTRGDGSMSRDGSRIIAAMPNNMFPQAPGTCPRSVTLDVATGREVYSEPFDNLVFSFDLGDGVERIFPSSTMITQSRFDGESFVTTSTLNLPSNIIYVTGITRGSTSGRTFGTAVIDPVGPFSRNVVVVTDPLEGRRQLACDPAVPNVTGSAATLALEGGGLATGRVQARVTGLQPNRMFGFLVVSDALVAPMPAAGSQGFLCLGGSLGRYVDQIQRADGSGQQRYTIDLNELPLSAGTVAALPGETWAFQSWYRDQTPSGAPTSNFSSAVSIEIR